MSSKEEAVSTATTTVKQTIKKHTYDIISIVIVLAIVIASLDIFGLRDITLLGVGQTIIEWLPFFFAEQLLNNNMYEKGVFVGKNTSSFSTVIKDYSAEANKLNGEQINVLPEFCDWYNIRALKHKQTTILRSAAISYEHFTEEYIIDEKSYKPLIILSKSELEELNLYTEFQIKKILKAQNTKIAGLKPNLLLSDDDNDDDTYLGETELQLRNKRRKWSVIVGLLSTLILTIIGIKDVVLWGWTGILIVLFKTAYVFARSCITYFKGYNDITIKVANHIIRKTDKLKLFMSWYEHSYKVIK